MNDTVRFFLLLAVMAGVTYLVRMIPFVLIRKKITNRFLLSFLHYIPYTVLAAMTVPAVFLSTGDIVSALAGSIVAILLSYREKSLVIVAAFSSLFTLIAELIILWLK